MLPFLSDYVLPLYFNAFIKSSFSYCLRVLIKNDRSGRYKLIDKIDNLLALIRKRFNNSLMVNSVFMHGVRAVYKLQCVSFMYDIFNNNVYVPFFSLVLNNMIHSHFTRSSANVYINYLNITTCGVKLCLFASLDYEHCSQ